MTEPPEHQTTSLYDYTDKSVPQAGYAAITYGVISLVTGLFALLQYFLYHRPGTGGRTESPRKIRDNAALNGRSDSRLFRRSLLRLPRPIRKSCIAPSLPLLRI